MLTATIAAPGYALDPETGVPVGTAIPEHIRVLCGPFNIAGAFTLVFGALFSAMYSCRSGSCCAAVDSLPLVAAALARGQQHSRVPATLLIALGGFIPGITSGLNRLGVTWSFFLGELLVVVLIVIGFIVSTEVFSARVRIGPVSIGRREVPNL